MNWISIQEFKPPKDTIINTSVQDGNNIRNEQQLIWDGKLWWHTDKKMYVYYIPTHWKVIIN